MLSKLFPKVHRQYEKSPFAADLEAFSTWLIATGYSRKSTCRHVFRLRNTLEHSNDIVPGTWISEVQLESVFTSSQLPALYRATQRVFIQFLKNRGRLIPKVPDGRFTPLLNDYRSIYVRNVDSQIPRFSNICRRCVISLAMPYPRQRP